MSPKRAEDYFNFLAKVGLTKHYGSLDATMELIELTGIRSGQRVIDLGCGAGATPVNLAKQLGTPVIGADLIEPMLHRCQERAAAFQVLDLTAFLAADARVLPFPDNFFDVVLLESVIVFFEDKVSALREYARVLKPGGYLGFTEMTWLKPPPQAYVDLFVNAAFVTTTEEESWKEMLTEAGFINVAGNSYAINPSRESKGRFQRYGQRSMFKTFSRMIKLILTDKSTRSFYKDGTSSVSRDIINYVGYGVYAGQKP